MSKGNGLDPRVSFLAVLVMGTAVFIVKDLLFLLLLLVGVIITALPLRDRLSREEKKNYVTTSSSFLAGITLAWLALAGLLGALALPALPCIIFALLCYLALIALNAGFLLGLARATRPLYFPLACGLIFVDLVAHGAGVIGGGVSFLAGRKY